MYALKRGFRITITITMPVLKVKWVPNRPRLLCQTMDSQHSFEFRPSLIGMDFLAYSPAPGLRLKRILLFDRDNISA